MERPDTNKCSDKEFAKWFWYDFNETCKKCKKKCKQSWIVTVSCSQYEGEITNEQSLQ